MKSCIRVLNNNQGKSLIIISFAFSIFSIISLVSAQSLIAGFSSSTQSTQSIYKNNAANLMQNIISYMHNPTLYNQMINDNFDTMGCLKGTGSCQNTTMVISSFNVGSSAAGGTPKIIVDESTPNLGFKMTSEACSTFNLDSDQDCILRPHLSWNPVCPAPNNCQNPAVQINIRIEIKNTYPQKDKFIPQSLSQSIVL